ncbi:endonuclease V [Tieghemostelium lacteum]|uniref:Endonuclease V n=1 Tax=Tieghemostelium lacteum TaxID=361077 RepID=A0A152A660_TIELA|nr:endonuclease V [Tieghemostelium lacteum]|eukprot:KYR01708.1 endonuclease V [Tieghemostelium lacteum]
MADNTNNNNINNNNNKDEDDEFKEIKEEWIQIQNSLKQQLILTDNVTWSLNELRYIGGVDISFVKDNNEDACACLIVLEYPSMNIVYKDIGFIKLTLPYIPGFLAFREVTFLMEMINRLKSDPVNSQYLPQVILVDGNGILHPRSFGLACHLGVLADIPTIGVGKTPFQQDGLNIKDIRDQFKKNCQNAGDFIHLVGTSGTIWAAALKSHKDSTNPIYVSQGHKLSLETTLNIVKLLTLYRVPEPIRQADLQSRDYIRLNFKPTTPPNTTTTTANK